MIQKLLKDNVLDIQKNGELPPASIYTSHVFHRKSYGQIEKVKQAIANLEKKKKKKKSHPTEDVFKKNKLRQITYKITIRHIKSVWGITF